MNLSRAFLDTNGAHQVTNVEVEMPEQEGSLFRRNEIGDVRAAWLNTLGDLNVCSRKVLLRCSTALSVQARCLCRTEGKYQLTETQAMVAKVPVQTGNTDRVSMMSYGFDPYLSSWSPYHGAVYAVTESIAKIVACRR